MSDAPKKKAAAFVIVGKDNVGEPLNARRSARDKDEQGIGSPSLYGAFAQAGITEGTSFNVSVSGMKNYVLPKDHVLLMIGNTVELEKACKEAHDKGIHSIETDSGKDMQLRYARIRVSPISLSSLSGQVDTLIALGATLPARSEDGWHEYYTYWLQNYVTTEDVKNGLPGYIRGMDGIKKWIDK